MALSWWHNYKALHWGPGDLCSSEKERRMLSRISVCVKDQKAGWRFLWLSHYQHSEFLDSLDSKLWLEFPDSLQSLLNASDNSSLARPVKDITALIPSSHPLLWSILRRCKQWEILVLTEVQPSHHSTHKAIYFLLFPPSRKFIFISSWLTLLFHGHQSRSKSPK